MILADVVNRAVHQLLDLLALILFPSRKHINLILGVYTVIIAVGLAWYFANWLWIPATILCMALAWMLLAWFF
jgi:hypothetical protein